MNVSKLCRLDISKLNNIPLTLSALLPILADEVKTIDSLQRVVGMKTGCWEMNMLPERD